MSLTRAAASKGRSNVVRLLLLLLVAMPIYGSWATGLAIGASVSTCAINADKIAVMAKALRRPKQIPGKIRRAVQGKPAAAPVPVHATR